jgi:cysteine desulfurase / selenocysteine lyase
MSVSNPGQKSSFDVEHVRRDFPILATSPKGQPLVYLDNAATTQKPRPVIQRLEVFYSMENANIHRGVHQLSQMASEDYDKAREQIAAFIGASSNREVVFTRNATEAINLVAHSFLRGRLHEGDNIVLTAMEHHANIVPWQMLAETVGADIRVAPINEAGELDVEAFGKLLDERTRMAAFVHTSNALGTVNPARELCALASAAGVPTLVDAAQAVAHGPLSVQDLGCDFLVFSGHKLFGPTGIGVLWGREEILKAMPPYQGGGDMISRVSWEKTTFKEPPERFEAGTPHIAGAIGLATAISYLETLGWEGIIQQEEALLRYATGKLETVEGLRLVGTASHKVPVLSFVLEGVHPHDIGTFLDEAGIAVRTGHHCAEPLMHRLGLTGTTRASLAFYNTFSEIDTLASELQRIQKFFNR